MGGRVDGVGFEPAREILEWGGSVRSGVVEGRLSRGVTRRAGAIVCSRFYWRALRRGTGRDP